MKILSFGALNYGSVEDAMRLATKAARISVQQKARRHPSQRSKN